MRFCLLPSPLVTPAVFGPLAAELTGRGHEAVVAPNGGADVAQVLAGFVAAAAGADIVLPHSNAGRFGPAVAEEAGGRLVCLDSLLPGGERGEDREEWADFLRSRERPDGLLTPWSTWWPREDILATVGDHWDVVTAAEPRVALRVLLEDPPAPAGWLERRSGYVAFGDTYAAQAAVVAEHGWEVRRLHGSHLHVLTDPRAVADAVLDVVEQLT